MPQVVGCATSTSNTGGGQMLMPGVNGPICDFAGQGDPNTGVPIPGVIDLTDCDVGSTFMRIDAVDSTHQLYTKTTMGVKGQTAGVWTNK